MPAELLLAVSRRPRAASSCHSVSNHVVAGRPRPLVDHVGTGERYPLIDPPRVLVPTVTRLLLSGDHPFECEYCGSCFRDDGTLRGHKRIHTGEKPYECNGCGKRFSLKHQLETHYRVHTGESSRLFLGRGGGGPRGLRVLKVVEFGR